MYVLCSFIGLSIIFLWNIPNNRYNPIKSEILFESIFSICFVILILFLAGGVGSLSLKMLKFDFWQYRLKIIIILPLGLCIIAYSIFLLGIIGLLKSIYLFIFLLLLWIITIQENISNLLEFTTKIEKFTLKQYTNSIPYKFVFLIGIISIIVAFFQVFTPPWDYDGLVYHLQGPRSFLLSGNILQKSDNWFTYFPFTWEMLYLLGLGLGSEIFPRLIHFTTLILLILTTFVFANKLLPKQGGWLSIAILLGIPHLIILGTTDYTDLAWGLLQFLTIGLILMWIESRRNAFLLIAGVFQGFTLGNKYQAITGAAILLLIILLESGSIDPDSKKYKVHMKNGILFTFVTGIIAAPWYLKNIFLTGDPVFPFIFHQSFISQSEISIWIDYINSYGIGKNLWNLLMLPFDLVLHSEKFGAFWGKIEVPSPLFLLSLAYPIFKRNNSLKQNKSMDYLAVITFLSFIFWALGSQQVRFLVPLYPGLSILSSYILIFLFKRYTKYHIGRILVAGSVTGMILVTCIYMTLYFAHVRPDKVIAGTESRQEFLRRVYKAYSGIEFVNMHLTTEDKILFLWDGRTYFCERDCISDNSQSHWASLVYDYPTNSEMSAYLQEKQITHLFLSKEDVAFFLKYHDREFIHKQALEFLVDNFTSACTDDIYNDKWVSIYKFEPGKLSCK